MTSRTFVKHLLLQIGLLLVLSSLGFARSQRGIDDVVRPDSPDPLAPMTVISTPTEDTPQDKMLGFRSANAFEIGNTWYDMQQNGSMGRQIVVGNGWVHNVWNYLPGASNSNRNSSYYAWQLSGPGTKSVAAIDPVLGGGGFSAIDFDPTAAGAAVVTYHRLNDNLTRAARDTGAVNAAFAAFSFSGPGVNCQGIISGTGTVDGPYLWPKIAVDVNGSGQSIAHIVSVEYRPAEVKSSLVYYRSNLGISAAGATCASWIDSVTVVGAVVAQDPNSDRVAIVYPVAADWSQADAIQQRNNDAAYRQSSDLGVTWSPRVNITNYTGADDERLYTDLNGMYTSDGCLHVLWTTSFFDSATAQVGNQGARLYHWSDCSQCQTLLLDADNLEPECKRGIWNKNVSKMSLSECTVGGSSRLYASYTYFAGDEDGDPAPSDCSQGGFANAELYAQVSQNGGATWGLPVNLTNTTSHNCPAGNCLSEHWSSSALYVTDSLRLQYILDKDPGSVAYAEGSWTLNSVANLSHPCFAAGASYSQLAIEPAAFNYPFHTSPSQVLDTFIVLTNSGDAVANYTRGIVFQHGANWLVFPNDPPSGSVPVGCVYFDTLKVRVTGPALEGFYEATVGFTYHNGTTEVSEQIEIDLYNYAEFYQTSNFALRTATVRTAVNQAARAGSYSAGNQFTYMGSGANYLRDASLILGTSRNDLSWLIYDGGGGAPTASNPYGRLYAASALVIDSTGSSAYRFASGAGVNRDSTIAYRVRYYAPKDAANSDFLLARVDLSPGPHNTQGRVDDLTVGFAADWDIPSDIAYHNSGGGSDSHQLVYQQGTGGPAYANRYGGLAVLRVDGQPAPGGFAWESVKYVTPLRVYHVDSLWNRTNAVSKFESSPQPGDLNCVVVGAVHESIVAGDSLSLIFVLAGQLNGSLSGLKSVIEKAWQFNCQYVSPDQLGCPEYTCGDADGNSLLTISDAVFLISYIFGGGPAPSPLLAADCDCNQLVTISDAVYLISYIFGGGPAPCAACP